jgi:integrase
MTNTPAKKTPPDVTKNTTSATQNITSATQNTSQAIEYWQSELATKNTSTKDVYLKVFNKFLAFIGKTADELLKQRQKDQINPDLKIQRRIESQLKQFIAKEAAEEEFKPATLQLHFAAIRSFFEIHYYPLKMRRGDYPTGESLGVRAATKDTILKAIEQKETRNKAEAKAVIIFLKDSGLRASDARRLNYGDVQVALERGDDFIQITMMTKKVKTIAKTFIGEEAIRALKEYLGARRKGSRRIPPETITEKSPLFRTWESHTAQRIPRETISSIVRTAFLRIGEKHLSAHSLRKYLQTSLEAANVNPNWIDQILGHRLINSRDAYSKPSDEQLYEAYVKAYKFIRIYPEVEEPTKQKSNAEPETSTSKEEYAAPPTTTYQYTVTIEGTQLHNKPK